MPTTLELLRAEKEAQEEEKARPPICDVESARALIADTSPAASENLMLEMCILRIEEFEKNYRLELIDRELELQYETLLETFEGLDVARHCKFLFQLTIWKNRKAELNHLEFRRGFSYRFEKVHSLRLLYGNPVGSMQIRDRIRADPLPTPGVAVQTPAPFTLLGCGDGTASSSNDAPATPPHESTIGELQQFGKEGPAIVTPAAKRPAKPATSKDKDDTQNSKRPRKDSVKLLCFDSPRKTKRSTEAT